MLFLKTVSADGQSYGGFRWPLKVGATIEAPDWNRSQKCGGGLHGLLNGQGNGALLNWAPGAKWIVFSSDERDGIVNLGDKYKVRKAIIVHVGNQKSATQFLIDAGITGPIVGAFVVAGDNGTATVGYGGTATAGNCGTATAGNHGTATVGDYGTSISGYGGTAAAGDNGTLIIKWIDDNGCTQLAVGYVGKNGIEPNKPYRVAGGKLVLA